MLVNDLKMYYIGCDGTKLNRKREKLDKLLYKRYRKPKWQSRMNNPEKLAAQKTEGQRQKIQQKSQLVNLKRMNNTDLKQKSGVEPMCSL